MKALNGLGFCALKQDKTIRSKIETLFCLSLYLARRLAGRTQYEDAVLMASAKQSVFDDIYTMF